MKKIIIRLFLLSLIILLMIGCSTGQVEGTGLVTAIIHVNVIPMDEEIVLKDQVVLIDQDEIAALGSFDEIEIPPGATIIDGEGAYLIPGLADMHVHIYQESREDWPVSPLNLYIAKGVTTIRDCGTAPIEPSDTFILDWRDEILNEETVGPMIYSSGRTVHGPIYKPSRVVEERFKKGFDFVKLYFELSVEEFEDAQGKAEELGMYTVGHIPYQVGFELAISQGLDEIAHIEEISFDLLFSRNRPTHLLSEEEWLSNLITTLEENFDYSSGFDEKEFLKSFGGEYLASVISGMLDNDVSIATSVAVYETVNQKLFDLDAFLAREENIYLVPGLIDEIKKGENRHQLMPNYIPNYPEILEWKTEFENYLLQQLHTAGVLIVSGTDAGSSSIGVVEGFATHDELLILTELGFTPFEALQTATVNAAIVVEKMTGEANFGIIAVGKQADLILISGNPLEDITNSEKILGVMVQGEWFSQEELEELIKIEEE